MQRFIDFIDHHFFDNQLYFVAPTYDGTRKFELLWRDRSSQKNWRIREKGASHWEFAGRDSILRVLIRLRVDLRVVEAEVKAAILTQVVFADMLHDEAKRLFGEGALAQASRQHRRFLKAVSRAVETTASNGRHRLSVIAGEGSSSSPRAGHLRLLASVGTPDLGSSDAP